ncbi:DsbA family oxidoreductase [Acinetobacter gyllenbergii]|uniref:DsbA family oxidoreductase n=1 Tax=Acinetobacter gyllenbergii TaxID=134534 RepID=UPI003F548971
MKIDIWSDVICPFCYIGKRKLEIALEQTGIAAEIHWHSFELNPSAPESYGIPLQDVMSRMYGLSPNRALGILHHEEQEAARVGLDFQWEKAKPGNTFNVHRLIHLASSKGIGTQAKEYFLHAYFTLGLEIGNPEVLRQLATEIGLARDDIEAVLGSNQFSDEVRADEKLAASKGIHGVPYFIINDQTEISGAREISDFVKALIEQNNRLVSTEENSLTCNDGFCQVVKK